MNNVRKGIKFDQKENYEIVTSTSPDFPLTMSHYDR